MCSKVTYPVPVPILFACKSCDIIFSNVEQFIEHKKDQHFLEWQNVKCIIFEEATQYEQNASFPLPEHSENPGSSSVFESVELETETTPPMIKAEPENYLPEIDIEDADLSNILRNDPESQSDLFQADWTAAADPLGDDPSIPILVEPKTELIIYSGDNYLEAENIEIDITNYDLPEYDYDGNTALHSNLDWSSQDIPSTQNQVHSKNQDPSHNHNPFVLLRRLTWKEIKAAQSQNDDSESDEDIIFAGSNGRQCKLCHKFFSTSPAYRSHVRFCEQFNGPSNLGQNQIQEKQKGSRPELNKTLEKTYPCKTCGAGNLSLSRLQIHTYGHGPTKCEYPNCSAAFTTPEFLRQHIKKSHYDPSIRTLENFPSPKASNHARKPRNNDDQWNKKPRNNIKRIKIPEKTYKCETCGTGNLSLRTWQNHQNSHNYKKMPTKCGFPDCSASFTTPQLLRQHIQESHSDPSLQTL